LAANSEDSLLLEELDLLVQDVAMAKMPETSILVFKKAFNISSLM
jgi:hypothetical protein